MLGLKLLMEYVIFLLVYVSFQVIISIYDSPPHLSPDAIFARPRRSQKLRESRGFLRRNAIDVKRGPTGYGIGSGHRPDQPDKPQTGALPVHSPVSIHALRFQRAMRLTSFGYGFLCRFQFTPSVSRGRCPS